MPLSDPTPEAAAPSSPVRDLQIMDDTQAVALQRSVSAAISAAMDSMSSVLSQSIAQALAGHPASGPVQPAAPLAQQPPVVNPPVSQDQLTGAPPATHEHAHRSRKRAYPRQAERARSWKSARAHLMSDSDAELGSDEEAFAGASAGSEEEAHSGPSNAPCPTPSTSQVKDVSSVTVPASSLIDPLGEPMFDPDVLHHPRSAEWLPADHVGKYLEYWVRRPLSKEARNKMRAECPRPIVPNKVCDTPVVDPKVTQFLAKSGWNPRKGLDSALRSCQDKLLDIFGPLAKLFELAESARSDGSQIDPEEMRGWVQRAICIAGNTNTSLSIERRKSILFKVDPKLANLALTESGADAQGHLFGDSFIKDLSRFPVMRAEAPTINVPHFRNRSSHPLSSRPEVDKGVADPIEEINLHDALTVSPPPSGDSLVHCIGGRLRRFSPAWAEITSDPWVLSTVEGFHVELVGSPDLIAPPPTSRFSHPGTAQVDLELLSLYHKRAIERAPRGSRGVLSSMFLVQKKGGQMRPVINLRALNAIVRYRHFKMEGIHLLRDLLLPGDWFVKLDLKDAYLTVPIAAPSRDLLRFLWNGEIWRFTCLPFGLSSAPWCFTKLMRPVVAWLRSRGVRLIIYLDDMLLMHQSAPTLLVHLRWTTDLLSRLGFLINHEKSCLTPSQRMEFLGFTVDSVLTSLSLPTSKLVSIRKELRRALAIPQLSLRHLARIIGLLASSIQAVFPAPLHYRALQRLKIAHLRAGASFADTLILDPESREELVWWIDNLRAWNGRAIFGLQPELTIESDASLHGWGAHCNGISTGGRWSVDETRLHINALELLAGSFAIRSFTSGMAHACIRLRMDNVSAVRYINRLGGTRSATLARLAKDFWSFCLSREVMVQAEYLPGLHNGRADWGSRYLKDSSDWMLAPETFSVLSGYWGPFGIDLFASRLNTQLPRFFSWRPDPAAEAVDAFLQSWSGFLMYAFPPFAMIPRMLLQVRRQLAELVVVVPFWGTQAWFPSLLGLLIDVPLLLPSRADLLQDPQGFHHPLLSDGSLRLVACRISGRLERSSIFLKQLDAFWTTRGLPAPENLIGQPGDLGLFGAWNGTWIPFRPL
ncbi:uncharacterized protein LOC122930766 [Bufo gargarizans]|uniref:uncharacterized protein LOC122930766 n=1 Tax=Bufo gargarizans TaxID=30331 RepID=UPI001CF5FE0F|nr:uncharacterized protein LOC122930766 [Bufo gargarizans]